MLEKFFPSGSARCRHRDGVYGPYIDGFVDELDAQGYSWDSVRLAVWSVSKFGAWLAERGLTAGATSENTIAEFCGRQRQPSWTQQGSTAALRMMLDRLRQLAVVAKAVVEAEDSPVERLIKQFGQHLREERGLSAATLLNYCPVARQFITERYGTDDIDLSTLSASDIHGFLSRHARDYCRKRAKLMVTGLRSFLRFLYLRGQIPAHLEDQVLTVPCWRGAEPPRWMSADNVERVLQSCDRRSAKGQRDYAMLLLLARLGLRAGEVVSLELEDIHWETGELCVRGKGQQRKRFPLPEDVGEAIASYLKHARRSCCGLRRVFLRVKAPYRGMAGSSTLDTAVRQALLRAGLDPPCKGSHLFRHSLATNMLRNGATLTQIGQILHHASPDTTSIYAKVDIAGLRALALPWPGDRS